MVTTVAKLCKQYVLRQMKELSTEHGCLFHNKISLFMSNGTRLWEELQMYKQGNTYNSALLMFLCKHI